MITVKINDVSITALGNTDSTMNFMSGCCAKSLGLKAPPTSGVEQMADSSKSSIVIGMIKGTITLHNQTINDVCLYVLKSLIGDLVIGTDLLERFKTICLHFGGNRPALHLNTVPDEPEESAAFNKNERCYSPSILKS